MYAVFGAFGVMKMEKTSYLFRVFSHSSNMATAQTYFCLFTRKSRQKIGHYIFIVLILLSDSLVKEVHATEVICLLPSFISEINLRLSIQFGMKKCTSGYATRIWFWPVSAQYYSYFKRCSQLDFIFFPQNDLL